MTRSYYLGILIVLGAVVASAGVCVARIGVSPPTPFRAAQDLGEAAPPLGDFRLVERSGREVTPADLSDRVAIVSFIFTRCPLSCPRITTVMKGLQGRLARSEVLLVSLSVDPAHDTPGVLTEYARKFGALPDRWWFLTGPKSLVHDIVQDRFKLSLMESPAPGTSPEGESIVHSDRLALVDRGRIVGLFDSNDPEAVNMLVSLASWRALPDWVRFLPKVNATLNALSAILLLAGWVLIRRRLFSLAEPSGPNGRAAFDPDPFHQPSVRGHVLFMVLALATSTAFLGSYLVYHFHAGSFPFRHGGLLRVAYFTILLSHTVLAASIVPLVTLTVYRAIRREFARHAIIAQVTFPIWLYVATTGVVIYLMLYQMPVSGSQSLPPF